MNESTQSMTDVLGRSFESMWIQVAEFIPLLIVALAIVIIGWIIGAVLGNVTRRIVESFKIDQALRSAGVEDFFSRAGYQIHAGRFLGAIIKWFIFAVFVVAALDVLQLTQVNIFLSDVVLRFLPNVIVAVLILLFAAIIADVVQKMIVGSARAAQLGSAHFLGSVARWAIWIFAIFAALNQLGVAEEFVQTLFMGIVVAISLALGLSFGLGGQQAASRLIDHTHNKITRK